jgi:hypothetical protein
MRRLAERGVVWSERTSRSVIYMLEVPVSGPIKWSESIAWDQPPLARAPDMINQEDKNNTKKEKKK